MSPGWIKSCLALVAISVATGCSTTDRANDNASRGGDSPARLASSRDGGTDRINVAPGQTRSILAFPTGDRATSIVQLEAVGPEEVRVGQPYNYTLRVTNLTDTPLHEVRVNHVRGVLEHEDPATPATRPTAGFAASGDGEAQVASAKARAAGSEAEAGKAGTREVWNVGTLKARESRTQQMTGTADQEGTIANCLAVSYEPTLCVAVRVVKPALQVVKEGPSQILICQDLTYNYRVTNTGSGVVENVRLEDALPEGLQTAAGQRNFAADIGTLKQGESKNVSAKLRATKTGRFTSRATARSGDVASQSREVATVVQEPVLAVSVEGPEAQYVGQAVNYRVTVRNTSDVPAEKTVIRMNAVGGSERIQPRELGTIPAGESRTFAVNIGAGRGSGNTTLTAIAEAVCAKPAQDSASVSILTIPALLLECVDAQDPVVVGQNTVYHIEVKNQGSGPDNQIALKAVLPPEMQFVRGGGATNVTADGQTLNFAPLPTLAPSATAKWTVEVKALKAADARFYIEMGSESLTRTAAETEPTRISTGDAARDKDQGLPVAPQGERQNDPNK